MVGVIVDIVHRIRYVNRIQQRNWLNEKKNLSLATFFCGESTATLNRFHSYDCAVENGYSIQFYL